MKIAVLILLGIISILEIATGIRSVPVTALPLHNDSRPPTPQMLAKLPLSFEMVKSGQQFISRGLASALTLSPKSATWHIKHKGQQRQLRMTFVKANVAPRLEGLNALPARSSYFVGNDSTRWRTGIVNYGKVRYENLWPEIALVYYGNQQDHEFDFVLAPQADPSAIRFRFDHAGKIAMEPNGDLVLKSDAGDVRLRTPVLYQEIGGEKRQIKGSFVIRNLKTRQRKFVEIGFQVGRYDRSRPLVIDPVITFSSFLGSYYGELASAIKVDAQGFMYVAGSTSSYYFPTTPGALQTYQETKGGCSGPEPPFYVPCSSAFISKITPTGDALVYSTYLGGDFFNYGESIAIDNQGQVYIAGSTDAANFPVTPNAWQKTRRGPRNGFIAKLNANGTGLVYSTYLGGSNRDWVYDLKIDNAGNAYVCGATNSPDFPVTPGAAQTVFRGGELLNDTFGEAFILKLNPTGSGVIYSTLLGGTGREVAYSLALDTDSRVTVAGMTGSRDFPVTADAYQTTTANLKLQDTDAFVARLNPAGTAFTYASLIGADGSEQANSVAVNGAGEVYLFGITDSEQFPITANAIQKNLNLVPTDHNPPKVDCFVLRLNPATKTLVYSTYLGGRFEEQAQGMVIDNEGYAYLTGYTFSGDFPTTPGERQYGTDAFLTKIHPSGDYLVYSTTIGGMPGDGYSDVGFDITRDQSGRIYIAGTTASPTFPVVNPGQRYGGGTSDAFILRAEETKPAGADMTLRLSRSETFAVNRQSVYRIHVLNLGAEKSNGPIAVKTTLPAGLSFVSAIAPDWTCAANGQDVTCTTQKSFDLQESSLIQLTVEIGGQTALNITCQTTLSYNNDSVTNNNSARDDAFVTPVCSYAIFPVSKSLTLLKSTGSEGFGVRAPLGCRWRIKSQVPWIQITSPVRDIGTGPGLTTVPAEVRFNVEEYTGIETRTGTILIENEVFTVTQVKQTVSVNAASYAGGRLAQGSIAAMFGVGLATTTASATSQPLPTNLAGTTVIYRQSNGFDYPAQLFFVSPNQVNYLVPKDVHPNDITVVVTSGNGSLSGGTVNLSVPEPGLFSANSDGQGIAAAAVLRVKPGNVQVYEPISRFDSGVNRFVPVPIDLGPESDQVYLILFGTGLTNPSNSSFPTTVKVGGTEATVTFIGRQGDYVGLDQVNVLLPRTLIGRGDAEIELGISIGAAFPIKTANKVRVQIR